MTTIRIDAGPLSVGTYSNSIEATLHAENRELSVKVKHFNGVDNFSGNSVFNTLSLTVKDEEGHPCELVGFMSNDQFDEVIAMMQASVKERAIVDTPAERAAEPQYVKDEREEKLMTGNWENC